MTAVTDDAREWGARGVTFSARTRLLALLGDPVEHSLSPAIQNAAFEVAGVDGAYVALRCDDPRDLLVVRGEHGNDRVDALLVHLPENESVGIQRHRERVDLFSAERVADNLVDG